MPEKTNLEQINEAANKIFDALKELPKDSQMTTIKSICVMFGIRGSGELC